VLTLTKNNDTWADLTYYGAVRLVGETAWSLVELSKDGLVYTGEIGGLADGEYEWKIYAIYDTTEIIIASGTEYINGDKVNEFTFGVTSLDIEKTVESVTKEDSAYTITGKIIVENTGEYPAIVTEVKDTIEYKMPKGPHWGSITPSSFTHNVPDIIPLEGGTYDYSVTFSKEGISSSAWRNLIEITIFNKPNVGLHTYHYRADFELPNNPGPEQTQLELTVSKQYSRYGYWEVVQLAAVLTAASSGEPVPNQYVSFYVDGHLRRKMRTNSNGIAKYSLWTRKSGKTHTAYAMFEGNSEHEASTSDTVTWTEQRSYYRWYWW